MTFNEIRRLFTQLITNTTHTIDHWLHWSTWRSRHQAIAKTSHYRRRAAGGLGIVRGGTMPMGTPHGQPHA